MAAQVDVQPGEVGRSVAGGRLHLNPLTDSSNTSLIEIPAINQARLIASEPNKPSPAPKPRLSPKPFAVERNPTIKPILAPKPQPKPRPESTLLPGHKPEPPSNPKPLQPAASVKARLASSNPNRPAPTSFKTSNKLNAGQTTKPIAQPFKPAPPFDPGVTSNPSSSVLTERQKPAASSYARNLRNLQAAEWFGTTQREDEGQRAQGKGTSITRAKSMGFLLDVGQEVGKKERVQPEAPVQLRAQSRGTRTRPVSAIFPDSPTKAETAVPTPRWAGRRPLSADLTSKFESIGLSLHRKSLKADAQENAAEEKSPALKREQDRITPQRSSAAGHPALTDQSKAEETAARETDSDDDKRGASIKSRISLLLDSSSSLGPTGQGSDFPSPVQPSPETESALGVKMLIKQLTEDTTPTQSAVMKPSVKPRPLPLDRTKRFSSERSPDLISLSEAADRHEIIKDPQRRAEESVVTPNDQKTFLDSKDSQEQLRRASSPEGPGLGPSGAVQTVRASLFENVVERHSVLMMDDGASHGSPSSKRRDLEEDDGTLFIATYREPASPSSPLHVRHAFDTVQAIEKNRAVSEMVPSAQWEDKAMTLRSRRSDGTRPVAEGTGQSVSSMAAEPQPRYLTVGAITKFSNSDPNQSTGLEKGMQKDSQREGQERVLEQDDAAASPKRLKMLPTEEQSKPRATYFALTGQMQEPFFLGEVGTSIRDVDDHSSRSALGGVQGKILSVRRNPSLEEAFGKTSPSQEQVEGLMMRSHLSSRELVELERQRLKERKEREEAEKTRRVALEQEMFRMRELEKDRHREVDLRSALDEQRKEEMLDTQKKRDLQKETERHMAKLKELEMEKQAHREFARMKELEMQREAERQRQKVFEKQKREMEEKQRALEMQKQIELEKQRLQEAEEKLKLERERQWQSERMQERERQRERERQKQREEERQRELDKERRLLEIQKEKQKMEEMEKLKEQERQQLLEIQKQKQREKERQQAVELEKQRLREKLEREQAEKMKQMALEQEMLRIRELDKEKERQKEMERERQKEIEREKQRQEQERQLMELQKQRQREKERQQQIELENQRLREKKEREEAEKIRQMALEQEMLRMRELEKEKERQKEMERERQREIEREKQRALEQQRQRDLERERQRQLDIERQEMENQRLRQKEQEKEKKRLEDLERLKEMERQQLLEFEKRRLKMEEMEKLKEQERQQFLEIQKQKQREKERQQAIELEKQRLREKLEREQAEKMRQIAKQQEAERHRLKEKQRKEEQERLRQESAPMRPKVLDLDSVLRKEPLVKATAQRSDPANRWKEPYKPGILDIDSFSPLTQHSPGKDLFPVSSTQGLDSDFGTRSQHTPERDVSWKAPPQTSGSFSSPVWTAGPQDPWELQPVEMSVDKPAADPRKHVSKPSAESLLFRQDEQPWTPQRSWTPVQDEPLHSAPFSGTEAGTANTPSGLSGSSSMEYSWLPRELQPQESRGAAHHQRRSQGSQELNRNRSRSVSRRSAPASSSLEGNLSRVRSRSAHREQDRHSWVPQKQAGEEEEGKDSETPVRDSDSQYGTWETGLRTDDSLTPATPSSESNLSPSPKKPTSPLTPGDAASLSEANTQDGIPPASSAESQPLAFPDAPTALLDTSVLRSRAQLGKKRGPRTRPSRAARQTTRLAEKETSEDWLYRDSTDAKPERKEDDSDSEEQTRGAESSPAVALQPQRVALFPGMDPSALKAQLRRRGDSDNQVDGAAASPSQLSRSPKSPFLPRAARVLPPPGGKENGEEDSPQWLKELKSKKRLSQYESES
ncbi:zinc finger CCCH domain-containing protein 13 isoform X2 [Salarias fasciatus]|uniref:zinc finger CCCH domain-containing protein 13 isoform X2 n=1 Tax=Salarias fasciatus TaxID=181472 RepID=UPI00117671FE|nr:zinc finger CCCH domain-containing protein 13-like isoform X2 [Salarias fasciatus]